MNQPEKPSGHESGRERVVVVEDEAVTRDLLTTLLSAEFARLVKRPLRSVGRFDLRGISKTSELFALVEE